MKFDDVVTNNVGRIVAFVLTPILLPGVGAVAFWLQNVIGIDLQQYTAVAVGFVVSVVTGCALVAYKWLENRGAWEKGVAELEALYHAGQQAIEQQPKA
jgi:sulfite exporter TauE/SafE